MNDDSIVKIMQSLDLDFSKAVFSVKHFEKNIETLNKQLENMKLTAMQSANSVNSIFSSQLGQVANSRTIVDQYGRPFRTIQDEARAAAQPVTTLGASMNNAGTAATGMGNQFATSAIQLYALRRVAREVTETIKDVEMGMIEIQRIMTDSSFVFEDYRSSLLQLGIEYGQTFGEVQKIALRWAQSGYNVADSLELTRTSLLALNTAELNAQQATEAMIGIMAQWNLQAEDMALVMDKVNITADRNAVTSQDLVDGLLRSSGAAKIMNLSLDETIGLLTVMREASGRTGREVGNALNSILSYIQRPGSINTLEGLGIDVFADAAKTQFRNVLDIFKDIHANWNTLSADIQDGFVKSADDAGLFNEEMATALGTQAEWNDLQQRDISQAAAGVYRRNYFIGMIERLSDVQGVLNNLMEAEGYSMRENAKTMETLEKKTESLKTAAESLAVAVGEAGLTEALKLLVDAGTGAIELFNSLPDEIQKPILAFVAMSAIIKTGQLAFGLYGISVNAISTALGGLTASAVGATTAIEGATFASKALAFASNHWIAILAGAAALGSLIYTVIKKNNEELERSVEVLKNSDAIDGYISKYEDLANKSKLTTEEQQEFLDLQGKIKSLMPEVASAIDSENVSLEEQLNIIKELNEQQRQNALIQSGELIAKYGNQEEKIKKNIEANERALINYRNSLNELLKKQAKGIELTEKEKQSFSSLSRSYGIVSESIEKNKAKLEALQSAMSAIKGSTDKNAKSIQEYEKSSIDLTDTLNSLNEAFKSSSSDVKELNQVMNEVQQGNALSADTVLELIEKYDLSSDSIKKVTDGYTIEISTLEDLRKAKIQTAIDAIEAEKMQSQSVLTEVSARLANYGLEIEQLKNLAEAKANLARQAVMYAQMNADQYVNDNTYSDPYSSYLDSGEETINQALSTLKSLEEIEKRSKLLTGMLNDKNYGVSKSSTKDKKYENKPLEEALKLLEHRKKISEETQESIRLELEELNRINALYVKIEDERMNMTERIYTAEKRLRDKALQDSVNWINEKKNLNELSVEEEIAAWERVRNNQIGNLEAVKQAELNLYKLREQIRTDSFSKEENSIQHLTKLGILSVEEQIKKYRELYEVKTSTLAEEQSRVENLFDLYKKLISDQQKTVKDAHDEKIKQIDEEAKRKKSMHEDEIKAIEKELELLNRDEQEYDHDKKMADLKEQLAYWQVRTSEDARKKVAELLKQIDETEHKREVELKKQSLEERKKVLQDEVKSVENTAKEEREKLEKSYKQIEVAFDEHSINLIALASTMSQGMFEEFQKNYLIPLENALQNADYGSIDSILGGVDDFAQDAYDKTYNSNNAQIYRLASSILDLKRQYEYGGDPSAAQRATSIYDELSRLNPSVADSLHRMDYMTAQKYIEGLPKMHKGGKSLSYGAVEMMPGELTFPPDLSTKLESLISVLYQRPINQSSSSLTDNRREIKIEKLLNIEKNYMEDDVDSDILVRQLQRSLNSM